MGYKESKECMRKIRETSIRGAVVASRSNKQKEKSAQNVSEESAIRREIQRYIFEKVTMGYPTDELLKRLNFITLGKPNYRPYKKYFETWINSAIENASKQPRSKENDGEER